LIEDKSGNFYGTTSGGGTAGGGTVFKLAPDGSETVLYNFCSQMNCSDGAFPGAGLIADGASNLYGTTTQGGVGIGFSGAGGGTLFKLAPDGTETVLYNFCSQTKCSDGWGPAASLLADESGNFYSTTGAGGTGCSRGGCGTVFKLAPDGTETVLHDFAGKKDGAYLGAGLVADSAGNLYGETGQGGDKGCNCGTVFELTPEGAKSVLHAFRSDGDGFAPQGGLMLDSAGNLYGSANDVFKLTPDGTLKVLHYFSGGSDGGVPNGDLIADSMGNLYGTTILGGGTGCDTGIGCGIVFKLMPDGSETILHDFAGSDGYRPQSGVIADKAGNIYGTTYEGGTGCGDPGCGTVYRLIH